MVKKMSGEKKVAPALGLSGVLDVLIEVRMY